MNSSERLIRDRLDQEKRDKERLSDIAYFIVITLVAGGVFLLLFGLETLFPNVTWVANLGDNGFVNALVTVASTSIIAWLLKKWDKRQG